MNKKIITGAIVIGLTALGGTGCRKYLDVNTNPNVAQDVTPDFLLPSAEIYLASAVGTDLEINGSIWAQYWTQAPSSSQYKTLEQYSPTSSTYDRPWTLLYANCLEDLDQVERKGVTLNNKFYQGVAKILKAYAYQILTDGWNDIPYSESLKGQTKDGGIVSPHFDAQAAVYNGIIAMTKDGLTLLGATPSSTTIGGDLIYGGDIGLWQEFGRTLQLKMYLRLSERSPAIAQSGATALMAAGGFIDVNEDAQISFTSTAGNQNPLYSEIVGLGKVQNVVASSTVIDSMTRGVTTGSTIQDPRVTVFFRPGSTGYVGLRQGLYTAPASTPAAIPRSTTGADATDANSALAPVKFISSYESYFLQAEAAARGWGGAGTDSALFRQGIIANFTSYGLSTTQANKYGDTTYWGKYPVTGTVTQRVRHIITQKWFSMTGNQGFEAWTEWRRTGYPNFFHVSKNSLLDTVDAHQVLPRRFFYPDQEQQDNLNFPGQKLITDRVYWDIH